MRKPDSLSSWLASLILGSLLLGASTLLWAQNPGPDEVRGSSRAYVPPSVRATPADAAAADAITVKSQVVAVGVVIRDSKGGVVPGLKQADFQVFDNGKQQQITAFSVEAIGPPGSREPSPESGTAGQPTQQTAPTPNPSGAPRYIALYFDDVHTESGDLDRAKAAAKTLVQNGVEPGDKLAIFTGSSTVSLDFTSDAARVLAAIDQIAPHPRMSSSGLPGCPPMTPYEAYLVNNHLDLVVQQRLIDDGQRCMCDIDFTGSSAPGPVPFGSSGNTCLDNVRRTVETKAQQTWDLAEQISQLTLETLRGVIKYLGKMPGQRVLVVASSGYLNGDLELGYEQDLVVEEALHAGIVINSIDLKGLATGGPAGTVAGLKDINKDTGGMSPYELMYDSVIFGQKLTSLNASMWELADATGGTFFHNNNDLGKGFHRLTDAPAVEYQLAYAPESIKEDGKFHKIQVKLVNPRSYLVQARTGYFAPTKEMKNRSAASDLATTSAPAASQTPTAAQVLSPVDREILAEDSVNDVPASVTIRPGPDASGKPAILANVHVDVKMLSFQHKDDRSIQKLTFVLALFDEQGNFVSGQEGEMELALKESSLANFDQNGLNAKLWLEAPPGNYRLRAVAQEAVAGKMFASSQPVEIQ